MEPLPDDSTVLAADAMQQLGFTLINVLGVILLLVPVVFSVLLVVDVARDLKRGRGPKAAARPASEEAGEPAA